jgi:hypothetical protein
LVFHVKGRTQTEGENRAVRGIFGPKGKAITGGWRKLHNEEFHKL